MAEKFSKSFMNSISEENGLALMSNEHKSIYSVGISTGGQAEIRMAKALKSRHIIATTIDPKGVRFARQKIEEASLADQIEVKLEDISEPLPYSNNNFDFIYARLVLHYLKKNDLKNALQELYRVLKSNGKVFIVVRSSDCIEAQNGDYNCETGLTTYTSKSESYSRYFHSQDSICHYLKSARFHLIHVKKYDEQLCVDFQRSKPAKDVDNLIEVYCCK